MRLKNILKIIFTLALLGLVIGLAGPRNIASAFRGADPFLVLLALLLTPVCIFFKAYRWHLLARSRIPGLGFLPSFKSYMAGLTLAVITPGSLGELARGVHLDPQRGLNLTGLVTVDKFIDLAVLGSYVCLGLMCILGPVVKIACVAGIVCLIAGWLFLRPMTATFERLLSVSPASRLGRFLAAVKEIPLPLIYKCLGVAFINFAFYFSQMYLVVRAFAKDVELGAVAVLPTVTLSTIVPTIGGYGIRELTGGGLLSMYGLTWAMGSSAVFAHSILIMILPGVVGAIWVGRVALPSGGAASGVDKEAAQ